MFIGVTYKYFYTNFKSITVLSKVDFDVVFTFMLN